MKDLLPKIDSEDGLFHNGNPATGTQGTRVTDTWLNNVQEHMRDFGIEIRYLLAKAKLTANPAKQTQIYDAIKAIIGTERPLYSGYDSDNESLGATAKVIKILKGFIDSNTRSFSNYIPNSKKSNAVNSTSADTVATSFAAKTAYDKGVEALDKANTKADKTNPILTTNKWYADMDAVPDGTLFFAINQSTANQPYYNQGGFDAQAWQFDVGNQKVQMVFYSQTDIKVRANNDGINWSDWVQFLTDRHLSGAVNNSDGSIPASVVGVKAANDNANGRVSKSGDTMTGALAINMGNGYSSINQHSSNGKHARIETLPDTDGRFYKISYRTSSNNAENEVFFPKSGLGKVAAYQDWVLSQLNNYIPNTKKSNAVDSTSTDTVATSRAAKLAYDRGTTALNQANTANNNANGRVSKSGDTMTGHLSVDNGDYSSFRTFNTASEEVRWESAPSSSSEFASIVSATGSTVKCKIKLPRKSGTAVLDTEFSSSGGANSYVKRDGGGDVNGRLFRSTYHNETYIKGAIAFRVNDSTDNYTRFCDNPAAVRSWLGLDKAITDIRLGARVSHKLTYGSITEQGAGYVTTGLGIRGEVDGDDYIGVRPIQKYVNGTWITIASA